MSALPFWVVVTWNLLKVIFIRKSINRVKFWVLSLKCSRNAWNVTFGNFELHREGFCCYDHLSCRNFDDNMKLPLTTFILYWHLVILFYWNLISSFDKRILSHIQQEENFNLKIWVSLRSSNSFDCIYINEMFKTFIERTFFWIKGFFLNSLLVCKI